MIGRSLVAMTTAVVVAQMLGSGAAQACGATHNWPHYAELPPEVRVYAGVYETIYVSPCRQARSWTSGYTAGPIQYRPVGRPIPRLTPQQKAQLETTLGPSHAQAQLRAMPSYSHGFGGGRHR